MGDMLLLCTKCEGEQWFSVEEYSKDHLILKCEGCGVRIYSELRFVEATE